MSGIGDEPSGGSHKTWQSVSRIVTGLDHEGRSCALFNGPIGPAGFSPAGSAINLWQTDALPADNAGSEDNGSCDFKHSQLDGPGSAFILVHYPPGFGGTGARMHATDTIDYLIVLTGEVTLVLETGDVRLYAGDLLVDRGIVHGWRNDTTELATAVVVTVPALKLTAHPSAHADANVGPQPPGNVANWPNTRRVITGLDRDGHSTVVLDGPVPPPQASVGVNVWRTPSIPANNAGAADQGGSDFTADQLTSAGSSFTLVRHPPGFGCDDPQMHAADTLSMMVLLKGQATFVLDTGELPFRTGDVLIERGVNHGWRNVSVDPTLAAVIILPALPFVRAKAG